MRLGPLERFASRCKPPGLFYAFLVEHWWEEERVGGLVWFRVWGQGCDV